MASSVQRGVLTAVVYSGAGEDTCLHPAARTRLDTQRSPATVQTRACGCGKFLTCLAKEHVKDDVRSVIPFSFMCVCVRVHVCVLCVFECVRVCRHVCAHMYGWICVCVCLHVCVCPCVYGYGYCVCGCVCLCVCAHTSLNTIEHILTNY